MSEDERPIPPDLDVDWSEEPPRRAAGDAPAVGPLDPELDWDEARPSRRPDPDPRVDLDLEFAWPDPAEPARAGGSDPADVHDFDVLVESPEPEPEPLNDLYLDWSETELTRIVESAFRRELDSSLEPRLRAFERAAEPSEADVRASPEAAPADASDDGAGTVEQEPLAAPVAIAEVAPRRERGRARRRWLTIVTALASVAALVALVGGATILRRESGESASTPPAPPRPARLVFDTFTVVDGVELDRVWTLHGRKGTRFEATITYSNATGEPVSGFHEEVIPKSLATSVDEVQFDPPPTTVVEPDPVVQFEITVPAGGELTLRYEAEVEPDGNRRARLEQWAADQGEEVAARGEIAAVPEAPPPEPAAPTASPTTTARRPTTTRAPVPPPDPPPPPPPAPPPPPPPPPTVTTSPPTTTSPPPTTT